MMENTHEKYERCFISTVFEHASKKFKTHIQFARELWPGKGDANVSTRIRAIRDCNSRGKPQGLKMSDAAKMAEVLDIPLSGLALEVETKLRLGWSEVEGGSQLALFVPLKNQASLKNEAEKNQEAHTRRPVQPSEDEATNGH